MAELERVEAYRISDEHKEIYSDLVVSEAELVIKLDGEVYRTLHCLPTHLEDLARGHLVSEGICCPSDIRSMEVGQDGNKLTIAIMLDGRNPLSMEAANMQANITTAEIWDAMKRLDENSVLFRDTGGTHVAGIYDRQNYIFVEDVSRHCVVDKVIGLAFDNEIDLTNSMLITSGRQTVSTVEKAARVQIPVLVSISAPTSLAIETARKFGITLIGFARGHRFNIYSHEWRVIDSGLGM